VGDATDAEFCEEMTKAAVSSYGTVDILVNNVEISGRGSVTDVQEDFWGTAINVNLKNVGLTSKYMIPEMINSGGGSIINLVGLRAGAGGPSHPYAASKGGIIGLSNSMQSIMDAIM
jgi:NAD(P)-dependent dehydrogenase (short-subunit alcohol dehydrogenase family)